MKGDIVISRKNLPSRLPIEWTAIAWLLLDRLQPTQWIQGAVAMFLALLWISVILHLFIDEYVEVTEILNRMGKKLYK